MLLLNLTHEDHIAKTVSTTGSDKPSQACVGQGHLNHSSQFSSTQQTLLLLQCLEQYHRD